MAVGNFFRNRWWVVLASVLGLIVGARSINVFAVGVFMKPVSDGLGVCTENLNPRVVVMNSAKDCV